MNETCEFIPTRQSLLGGLQDSKDEESWQRFFDTYWKLIYNTGIRAGLRDSEAQDLVQETVLSVFRSIPNFHYDSKKGSFKTWLMRLTGWRIADQLRKRGQAVEGTGRPAGTSTDTPTIERVANPDGSGLETAWNEEWEKNLLEAACKKIKGKVDPRHYQVFDLHVVKQWPVSKVACTLKISRGSIYVIKHRICRLIKGEIRCLRTKPS
jgi:RNA polymerase sigma factor (sigma-70 family)